MQVEINRKSFSSKFQYITFSSCQEKICKTKQNKKTTA